MPQVTKQDSRQLDTGRRGAEINVPKLERENAEVGCSMGGKYHSKCKETKEQQEADKQKEKK